MKGVKFWNLHSYTDFGMILSSKEIGSPEPKIIQVEAAAIDRAVTAASCNGNINIIAKGKI